MKKMTIKEFKEESGTELITSLMKINNGYITSKELTNFGIHRMYLNSLYKKGAIEKIGRGIYIDASKMPDIFFTFSLNMPNTIYSHMTALYFYGLSIKAPYHKYDITVKKKYNNNNLRHHEVFYVSNNIYELGLTTVETPMGNKVRAYDIERCICDIIRSKNRMDSEHVKYSIKEYIKRKDKDLVKLSTYAEKMGIKDKVMSYVEVFYE